MAITIFKIFFFFCWISFQPRHWFLPFRFRSISLFQNGWVKQKNKNKISCSRLIFSSRLFSPLRMYVGVSDFRPRQLSESWNWFRYFDLDLDWFNRIFLSQFCLTSFPFICPVFILKNSMRKMLASGRMFTVLKWTPCQKIFSLTHTLCLSRQTIWQLMTVVWK